MMNCISRFPHIALFASKPIKKGDVLGFDYGEKFWVIKHKFFTCWCGGDKCKYSKTAIGKTLETYYRNLEEEADKQQQQQTGGRLKLKLRMEEGKVVKVDDSGLLPDEPERERRTPKLDEPRKANKSSSGDEARKSPKQEDRKSPKLEDMKPAGAAEEFIVATVVADKKPTLEVKRESREASLEKTGPGETLEVKKKKKDSRLSVESKLWKGVPVLESPMVVLPKAPKEIVKKIAKTQKVIDGLVDEIVSLTNCKNGGSSDVAAARAAVLKGLSSGGVETSRQGALLTPPPPATARDVLPGAVSSECTASMDVTDASSPTAFPNSRTSDPTLVVATAADAKCLVNGTDTSTEESPMTAKRGRGRPKKVITDSPLAASKPPPPPPHQSSTSVAAEPPGAAIPDLMMGEVGAASAAPNMGSSSSSNGESRPSTPGESPGRPRRQRKVVEKDL
jgi:hypothetical protein